MMLRGTDWTCALLVITLQLCLAPCSGAAFNVSLELQGDCSDQLTLICRHSDILSDPNWIHNRTAESGQLIDTAFPGVMYSVRSNTEHRVTISGVGKVQALDRNIIQCVYSIQGDVIKSNADKYSFIPPDYRPALSLVSNTANFSKRLSTFSYSFNESCSLYPRCTQYFSVEHTMSPQSAVSISSNGCSVKYTIRNLMRCVSYHYTATALIRRQRGNPVVVGDTVMLSPGRFTITSVSIEEDRNLIKVTYMENESDCPGYPTERYTVDIDGLQVADVTADTIQALAINHANGSVTLSLPLNQSLPENAVTLNMTKYNTVPTNRSNDTGNIVTEMVTWGTSAVFALRESPPGEESQAARNDEVVKGVSVSVGIVTIAVVGGGTTVIIVVIARWNKKKKKERMLTVNPQEEEPGYATTRGQDETPSGVHKWVMGAGRQLPISPEEAQKGGVGKPKEMEAGRYAAQSQHYAELDFAEERPIPAPPSDMFIVAYAEVGQA